MKIEVAFLWNCFTVLEKFSAFSLEFAKKLGKFIKKQIIKRKGKKV